MNRTPRLEGTMGPSRPAASANGLGDALLLWSLFALLAVATVVTYSRIPVRELYHVSVGGPTAGARAVLGFIGFPTALMALAVLPIVVDRLRARTVVAAALVAAGFAGTALLPNALGDPEIDARPVNIAAIAGVGLTLFLTLCAVRAGRIGHPQRRWPGDRIRVVLAAFLVVGALPWLAASLGFSLDLPVLNSVFLTDQMRSQPGVPGLHLAVHDGFHHGLAGVLLVLTALVLSRSISSVRNGQLRHAFAAYLAFLFAYGLGNAVQDFQLEQIVKRGWTSYELPMVLAPAVSWAWGALLGFALVVYVFAFRRLADGGPAVDVGPSAPRDLHARLSAVSVRHATPAG